MSDEKVGEVGVIVKFFIKSSTEKELTCTRFPVGTNSSFLRVFQILREPVAFLIVWYLCLFTASLILVWTRFQIL